MPTQTCRFWQVLLLLCLFAQSGMGQPYHLLARTLFSSSAVSVLVRK